VQLGSRNNRYIDGRNSDRLFRLNYQNNRRKNNICVKIAHNLRSRIRNGLKGINKSDTTIRLVGCSIKFLKNYLKRRFKPGMSWNNYGKWHIDHIRPCASFNLSKASEQKKCFHYKNLQPLWAEENLSKNDKYEYKVI
jgi:hypothetical protein